MDARKFGEPKQIGLRLVPMLDFEAQVPLSSVEVVRRRASDDDRLHPLLRTSPRLLKSGNHGRQALVLLEVALRRFALEVAL